MLKRVMRESGRVPPWHDMKILHRWYATSASAMKMRMISFSKGCWDLTVENFKKRPIWQAVVRFNPPSLCAGFVSQKTMPPGGSIEITNRPHLGFQSNAHPMQECCSL